MRAIAKVTSPVPLRYVLFLVVLGMLAAALTTGPMLSPGPAESAFPGANGKIAFRSFRDGNSEIYVMNADGSAQTNLSNNPAEDLYPAWSPDGSKIAFSSDRDGDYEIYVMNADGTGQTQITNNTAYDADPAWSPDGSKIAFNRQVLTVWPYGADIYVMNADGSAETSVTNNGLSGVWNGDVDWSPDGSKIAFLRMVSLGDWEVYVMNPDGSGQTNLTNNPGALEGLPTWSPDGSKIAYGGRGGVTNPEIFVMNADGGDKVRITYTADGVSDCDPAWSPDGSKIAFATDQDAPGVGGTEIYVMNANGSSPTRMTSNSTTDDQASWGPLPTLPPTSTATPTPTPTRTPTPTLLPQHGVGGTVKLPPAAIAAEAGTAAEHSGWATATWAALAGGVAAAAIGVGGWYARRRWLR